MKVIDLLNKIANGEEVPMKIKYDDKTYIFNNHNGYLDNFDNNIGYYHILDACLNDEVEIIEDKKIYKLGWVEGNTFNKIQENSYLSKKEIELLDSNFKELGNKINEIIDEINEMKEGK